MIQKKNIKINQKLYNFINNEVLKDISINEDIFWNGFSDIVDVYYPKNLDLLKKRQDLQNIIDKWHKENKSKDIYLKEKINTFEDLIEISSLKKEISLKYDLERNVNLVKFEDGKIDISFNEKLGKDFVRKLSEKLHEWTGKRWVITLTKEIGQKSFIEKKIIDNNKIIEDEKKGNTYKKFKSIFPDAELINVDEKE